MIEPTTSPPPPTGALSTSPASAATQGGFALALDAFLDAAAPSSPPEPLSVPARQDDAAGGKIVPQDASDSDGESVPDPHFLWFASSLALPAMPAPAPQGLAMRAQTSAVPADPALATDTPDDAVSGHAPRTAPDNARKPFDTSVIDAAASGQTGIVTSGRGAPPSPLLALPPSPAAAVDKGSPLAVPATSTPALSANDAAATHAPRDAGTARIQPRASTITVALPPASGNQPAGPIQPARQAFALALGAAPVAPRRSRAPDRDDVSIIVGAVSDTVRPETGAAVKSAAETQQAPLDLRQDRGIARMIDHIEALRDDADSRDTRIRLVPDALGTVDVAVHTVGDAVHVRFTAESAATRAVIVEAQPRLTEMAEARGVTIADASVGGGTAGNGQAHPQPQQTFSRPTPAAPRHAGAPDSDPTDSQRLA